MKRILILVAVLLLAAQVMPPAAAASTASESQVVKCNGQRISPVLAYEPDPSAYPNAQGRLSWVYPVSAGGGTTVSFNVDASGLPPGTYVARAWTWGSGPFDPNWSSPPITVDESGVLHWDFGMTGPGPTWTVFGAIWPKTIDDPAVMVWGVTIGGDAPCAWVWES